MVVNETHFSFSVSISDLILQQSRILVAQHLSWFKYSHTVLSVLFTQVTYMEKERKKKEEGGEETLLAF